MLVHGVLLIDEQDKVIEHQVKTGVSFEHESIAAWRDACKHGGTAIDVGAYTGLYSFVAEKAGADRVMAFEPNREVFKRLDENAELNKSSVECYMLAASDKAGTCGLMLSRARLTSGGRLVEGTTIETVELDSVVDDTVCAIKIDTEGHECKVLMGAMGIISKDYPVIITEALTVDDFEAQAEILTPMGYRHTHADQWNYIWTK